MSTTTHRAAIRVREGEEIFSRLAVACSDFRMFSEKHPRYLESCQSFIRALESFFEAHPEERHVLFVQRAGQVYFRKVPLSLLTPPAIKLSRLLKEKGVEGLRFSPDATLGALTTLIGSIQEHDPNGEITAAEAINRKLEAQGLKPRLGLFTDQELTNLEASGGLLVGEEEMVSGRGPALLNLPQLAVPLEIYRSALAALHDLMSLIGAGRDPKIGPLQSAAEKITEGILQEEHRFLPLTTLEYSDQFTFNHSVNVCLLVTTALKPLVENPDQLLQAGQAALLHDVGKSLLPEDLLYKRSVPHADERREIERHPILGAEVLLDTPGIGPMAVLAAFDHHRRPDGTGYPIADRHRLLDPVTALVAAADIFEALTAERPYKRRLSPAEAFQVFLDLPQAKGLEPGLRLLFDALSPFPPGTFVELDTGDLAVVTRTRSNEPLAPFVRLVHVRGETISISPEEFDLTQPLARDLPPPRIVRALPSPWETSPSEADSSDDPSQTWRQRLLDGTLLATEA